MTTRLTTRLATRLATRPAVGYTPPGGGPDPGTPVISIVGGGALLPGVTMVSDTSLPWLADGVQIAPASLSLELPWTVAPGAVITQPGSNALTVVGYHSVAADFIARRKVRDGGLDMEQTVQWAFDEWFRSQDSPDATTPLGGTNLAAILNDGGPSSFLLTCGARTPAGMITGVSPDAASATITNLVSGDWSRIHGVRFDYDKSIDSRCGHADFPQDAFAQGAYVTELPTVTGGSLVGGSGGVGSSRISNSGTWWNRYTSASGLTTSGLQLGLNATSRHESSNFLCIQSGSIAVSSSVSSATYVYDVIYGTWRSINEHVDSRQIALFTTMPLNLTAMSDGLDVLYSRLQEFLS